MTTVDAKAQNWKYMAGTEGTGEYLVLAKNKAGRLGIRLLKGGDVSVCIEPNGAASRLMLAPRFTSAEGWKVPGDGGQNRYSKTLLSPQTTTFVEDYLRMLETAGGELTQPFWNRLFWRIKMRKHIKNA